MILALSATPVSIIEANRKALAQAHVRLYRARLIERAEFKCEGRGKRGPCTFLAWSTKLYAQLVLRPKLAFGSNQPPEGDWVFCPSCSEAYDRKQRQRAS